MPEIYVGLMSGTSLDGIDAVVADFATGVHLLHAETHPFEPSLRNTLRSLIDAPDAVTLDAIGRADAELGMAYAAVAGHAIRAAGLANSDVAAIGCHGQTIRHNPDADPAFTWQLGDPNRIAVAIGVPVVADFRRMDVALGGQGAPLVPAFHAAMFRDPKEIRAVVNIGGIANITRLGPTVTGYDTGPGNGLMDAWIRHNRGENFDRDGNWAVSGKVDGELLAEFSADPFFEKTPPRSTGREHFNLAWLREKLTGREIAPENVQATLLAFTAETIAREVRRSEAARVLLCGGGARNAALREGLQAALGDVPVEITDDYGLDADFVEAAAFAWLARERLAGRPGNLPTVTGAGREAVLGGVYLR